MAMYEFFPGNYRWSYNVWGSLAAGAQFGDLALILPELCEKSGDDQAWHSKWLWLAERSEERAEACEKRGTAESAADSYFLASLYHKMSEQFVPPQEPTRLQSYGRVLGAFEKARNLSDRTIERVEIPFNGSKLPGYFIPTAEDGKPQPTVIFICGLETTKEISTLRVRESFARRGLHCLAVDTPGVGEALRLGKLYSRHDYEVPVGAVVDYLESREDVDHNAVAIVGSSLGGYYVARAAAFEPRLKATVAWGAQYDYHNIWHKRMTVGGAVSAPPFQLTFITGTETTDEALAKIKDYKIAPIGNRITCPFLIVHGRDDRQIPLEDAEKMFEAVGAEDKELKIYSGADGGAAHCQFDNHQPALLYVADWLKDKIGTS